MRWQKRYFALFTAWLLAWETSVAVGATAEPAPSPGSTLHPTYLVGSWIWAAQTFDKQTVRFWKLVEIPPGAAVLKARLRMTADNSYRAFLDGREFGQGSTWESLTEYELGLVLPPGPHVLAVEAFNDYAEAGLLAGLRVELADGRIIEVPTDATWLIVPDEPRGWKTRHTPAATWVPATIIAPFVTTRVRGKPWAKKPDRIELSAPIAPATTEFWKTGWFQVTLLLLCALAIVVCLRLLAQLAWQSRVQQILQRERARIARDIHDDMEAGLTQLVLFGEVAQSELPIGTQERARFEQVSEKGRGLLRSIDEIVWMVNSQRDTLRDFEAYVCRYAEEFLTTAEVQCRIQVDAEVPEARFDLAIRRNLFLATKEALNNVVRHSGAAEVQLKLHVGTEQVTVVVEDNGRGFDSAGAGSLRHGLSNMAHRTAEVGGSCRITSRPGQGCRVELAAPLSLRAQRKQFWQRWWPSRYATEAGELTKTL